MNNGNGHDYRHVDPALEIPINPTTDPSWFPTGEAVVEEFLRRYGADFIYVEEEGRWYRWSGAVWALDDRAMAARSMGVMCRDIGGMQRRKTVRGKIESAGFINGAIGRAKHERTEPISLFDQGTLLNCPDGFVDCDAVDWQLRAHRRDNYCSRVTASTPSAAMECPIWLSFLDKIMQGDEVMISYLQRVAGYCCTIDTLEQCFFFAHGGGANGKSVFFNTLRKVLGSYATSASMELFMAQKFERHPEELASLRGARMVVTSETSENASWSEAKIKTFTGGDQIRARFMRQNSFVFDPFFKIIVMGNNKPSLRSIDEAIRRRLHLIPFDVQIPEQERDLLLDKKLVPEYPAILAWMLSGMVDWRKHGLMPPDVVTKATDEYLDDEDSLGHWILECCEPSISTDPKDIATSTSLFGSWQTWCESNGEQARSLRMFVSRMKKLKKIDFRDKKEPVTLKHDHTDKGNGFYGLKLKKVESSYGFDYR